MIRYVDVDIQNYLLLTVYSRQFSPRSLYVIQVRVNIKRFCIHRSHFGVNTQNLCKTMLSTSILSRIFSRANGLLTFKLQVAPG